MLMMRDDGCNDYDGDDDDGRGKCFGVGRSCWRKFEYVFRIDFFMSLCSCLEHTKLRVYHTKLEITSPSFNIF